ncbi:hypothetical protein CA830_28125, partial [Burkholderia multivorans]
MGKTRRRAGIAGSVREPPPFSSTQSCKFLEQSCKSRARRRTFRYARATGKPIRGSRDGHDRHRRVARGR